MKPRKIINVVCLLFSLQFFFSIQATFSQTTKEAITALALDTLKTYTSLEEALKEPQSVYRLELKKEKLKTLPADIEKLVNLKYLDVSKNKLETLPKEIGTLKNLQYLNLSKNKLTYLPKEIGELKNLCVLNISETEINELPSTIGNLENLEHLDAWSSSLNIFPEELRNLKKLKTFDLRLINISETERKKLKGLLPNTSIDISNICPCQLGH